MFRASSWCGVYLVYAAYLALNADRSVFGVGLLVHEARVCEFALGGGCGAVNLAVRERLEVGQLEAVGERVYACVDEETFPPPCLKPLGQTSNEAFSAKSG
jgi:hypothetical protein